MRTNKKREQTVLIPESTLLSLVSSKLKGRVLFPKKLREAKEISKRLNVNTDII
ncbi:hypothetical protein [Chryseobacterium sp. R2ACT005]|uniref:hypothetical protein n=1 Tax=Chryseobacterium sp. R2ACT005 TaxID=3416668 RepID=UPI003CF1091A